MSGDLPFRAKRGAHVARGPRDVHTEAAERVRDAYKRPADDFAAAQAAHVDPRRTAFERLSLTKEHAAHVRALPGGEDVREPAGATPAPDTDAITGRDTLAADRVRSELADHLPEPSSAEDDAREAGTPGQPDFTGDRPTPEFTLPDAEARAKRLPKAFDADDKED